MPERSLVDHLASSGIELLWLIFGFVGAVLGVSYMPPMSHWQKFSALLSGLACAALGPQLAAPWYQGFVTTPMLPAVNNAFAFILGILGMFIVPGILVIGKKFQENPFWIIDWLRGRNPQ